MNQPRDKEIERRAYEIWERDGRPEGREEEHWRQAEQELAGGQGGEEPPLPEHYAPGEIESPGEPEACEVRHRLMMNSYLEDGVYARLVCAWVGEEIMPLFRASMEAAAAAGDLRPGWTFSPNDFWFAEHVAANIAYSRLPSPGGAVPYEGAVETVIADACRFILRGIGLTEAAIARYEPATAPADELVPA